MIDRYRLARFVTRAKNAVTDWSTRERFNTPTGYAATTPDWMAVWLLIAADNTMHLAINALALRRCR